MPSWLLILLGLITFGNRFVFLAETIRFAPGVKMRTFLSYSSFAVLTAIWTPIVFQLQSGGGLTVTGMDYFVAVVVAALLAVLKVRSILVVLLSTGLFFLLRFVVFA